MENEKIFELMTKMYSEMQDTKKEMQDTKREMQETKKEMREGFSHVNKRLDKVEHMVTDIEHTHGQKLEALFDGYIQNTQQLDRIEQKVSQHDEFILRRIQ